jgi:hypothetical protein
MDASFCEQVPEVQRDAEGANSSVYERYPENKMPAMLMIRIILRAVCFFMLLTIV